MPQKPQIQPASDVPLKISWIGRHVGTVLTAIGLVVGIITLIELSPRLSASQQAPFLSGDQVPSVAVSNDGYLRVTNVQIACFISQMNMGGNTFDFVMVGNGAPSQEELAPAESYAVSCSPGRFVEAPASFMRHIEVGVVAYYRPWPFTLLRSRKFFRFEGKNDGTKLNWFKQPPNNIEKQFDEAMRKMGRTFP